MLDTLFSIFLAILGLGFLIFIHELGHYFAARWMGMTVEAFGIGFGRALFSWRREGVEWRLNWMPLGGYVKIRGMEMKKGEDPYAIPGGFFSKSPWQRIVVSLAGPLTNLFFALLVFTLIWAFGGRDRPFEQYTRLIGWVDPGSELYQSGIRPGDAISSYGDTPYHSSIDHLAGPLIGGDQLEVQGFKMDYSTGGKEPYKLTLRPYPRPKMASEEMLTIGIMNPASFLLVQESPSLPSGLNPEDRVVWADGRELFSLPELRELLNDKRALLTVKRGSETVIKRVPRLKVEDIKLTLEVREELSDWQFESKLTPTPLTDLYTIPYNLTYDAVVENALQLIDPEEQLQFFPKTPFSSAEEPLLPGDRIIAVDGVPISKSFQLFYQLQEHPVYLIVYRGDEKKSNSLDQLEERFIREMNSSAIEKLAKTIGTERAPASSGSYHLIGPITPKTGRELASSLPLLADYVAKVKEKERAIEGIENSVDRERALRELKRGQEQLYLGINIADQPVHVNPGPFTQFADTTEEIWRTLKALVSGSLPTKMVSGPAGIVQAMQTSIQSSYLDGLFWLGMISLNLGFLNLMPIPVLDGGYILLFLAEAATKKKIKPEALERLILPFIIMLGLFFVYVTYNDLSRLLS